MTNKLLIDEIQHLGFEWPHFPILEELCVIDGDKVDIQKTLDRLSAELAYYQQQINEAYRFKQNTGADYSDFTDRFDDYVSMKSKLSMAIKYLKEIVEAVE